MRHGDDLPLQTLGGMHGEDLHPPGCCAHLRGSQTLLDDGGGIEVGQQPRHIGVGAFGVPGDDVGEPIQVLGPGAIGVHRTRRAHLGVDTDDPADLRDQIGDRVGQKASQPCQFGSQCRDAGKSRLGVGLRRARISQSIGQARGLGVGRGDDLLGGDHGLPLAVEDDRATPQRGQIFGTQSPARPGQHRHGRGTGGRIGDQPQHRHHLCHFGNRQQTGQAHHLHRDTARAERVGDRPGVGVAPNQHRGTRRFPARLCGCVVTRGDVISKPITFGHLVVAQRTQHGAGLRTGPGTQRLHRHRSAPCLS